MTGSCFAERLGHFLDLTEKERAALARLEERERTLKRGQMLRRENDGSDEIYVLRHGWMMSYVYLDDGSRQILRLHFPGDLIGSSNIAYRDAAESLTAITDAVVCPFEKQALRTLFDDHPRVAALLFAVSQAERVSLTDRLASLGRTSARARVGALLLDMLHRIRFMRKDVTNSFELILTQEEIGDATGLTAVHVNRMMRALAEEGMIERRNGSVTIVDERALAQASAYFNRFAELDTSWFPAPRG
ncbi:Crp/Fnr family transcriptional regulator [Sphingomonas sanxanigenens]|uniref:HTH crp-type domain-containing protein n=1 Tax=Sphingomonas sanxanigenens DSM 19645 = NX02 TaxID=1123269 RepID=W0ALU7_9SPHN|nr:Crp/Fnr family transcriptional regulator [Sphingomonas sanxanigenens]AHE57313.1 hypothetical protein NX02_28670 [Sphingomonas sanxanigenens DSM 19645 = NX02]